MDFSTFVISGPSTSTVSVGKSAFGIVDAGGAKKVTTATQCLTDLFAVTNPSGASPPAICGINTGEHSMQSSTLIRTLNVTSGFQCTSKPAKCAMKLASSLVSTRMIPPFQIQGNG